MKFSKAHIDRVYFLGIGGIGMSALARYFHREGVAVSGYDRSSSVVTRALEAEGIQVFHDQDASRLAGNDLIVYTPAVPASTPEMVEARNGQYLLKKRAEVLGELSTTFKTLAVAGTHGKTTTSTMLAHFLRGSGVDASAFLGGISRNLNGNFVHGQSDWMVTEADEYDRSFLHLKPHTGIITSLDPDHLDIYGDSESMTESYRQFAAQSAHCLVHTSVSTTTWARKYPSYGVNAGDIRAENLRPEGLGVRFTYRSADHKIEDLFLPMPGQHNVSNATAAIAVALSCGVDPVRLRDATASFKGIYRRFEVKLHTNVISHIDDYAHHPTEIEAAITAAREYLPGRKLTVVFQPHLFSRTRDFAAGFADALSRADQVYLLDIYPAREEVIPGISSAMLMEKMSLNRVQLASREILPESLRQSIGSHDVVLTLGAGDIDREIEKITETLQTLITTQPNTNEN